MRYNYAVINGAGKCYEVHNSTNEVYDPSYVPIAAVSSRYLSKYYYPVLEFVDTEADFVGNWYEDFSHTIKEVF